MKIHWLGFTALLYYMYTTLPTTSALTECPKGWLVYAPKCFYLSKSKLDHAAARNFCQRKRGDLATIRNQAEQDFLDANPYYIGLYKKNYAAETSSYWLDGNPSKYRNSYASGDDAGNGFWMVGGMGWYGGNTKDLRDKYNYICMYKPDQRCLKWLYRSRNRKRCGWGKVKKNRSDFVRSKQTRRQMKQQNQG